MESAARRPWRFAGPASGTGAAVPVTAWTTSTASPAAQMCGSEVRWSASTRMAPDAPSSSAASRAREEAGSHADVDHDDVGGHRRAVGEGDDDGASRADRLLPVTLGLRGRRDPAGADTEVQADAVSGQLLRQQRRQLRVERGQDVVGELDKVDPQPALRQRLDRLETDEPGPDDDGDGRLAVVPAAAVTPGEQPVDRGAQAVDVGDHAQRVHRRVVESLDRRAHRRGAGSQQQGVVGKSVRALRRLDGDLAGRAVDGGDPVPGAHVEVQGRAQRGRGVQEQGLAPLDLPGQVVRQAAVREGDELALLEHHDVGVLVQPAGAGRGAHAAGNPTHDDDAPGRPRHRRTDPPARCHAPMPPETLVAS
ncbi:hypothetical protein GCM10022262_39280 [Georgenia daeguensis]|uniref:Uncharacterized protein n=1 Tax=Georgenia daeguensis TaxID=908355 RepID=A0ABP6UL90_9MICO